MSEKLGQRTCSRCSKNAGALRSDIPRDHLLDVFLVVYGDAAYHVNHTNGLVSSTCDDLALHGILECSYRSSRIGQHHHADHAHDTLDNAGD